MECSSVEIGSGEGGVGFGKAWRLKRPVGIWTGYFWWEDPLEGPREATRDPRRVLSEPSAPAARKVAAASRVPRDRAVSIAWGKSLARKAEWEKGKRSKSNGGIFMASRL